MRYLNQQGAMFGLDARIALGIFGVLSMVTGVTMVLDLNNQRAKALATELADTGRAIEAINYDLREDLFKALDNPSEKNAFMALYDNGVISTNNQMRGRWVGPYIKFSSNLHPSFGEMVIQKRTVDHTQECTDPQQFCYLWLVYNRVKPGVIKDLDEIIDGKPAETVRASQSNLDKTGRVQWTKGTEGYEILYYNASKALSIHSD